MEYYHFLEVLQDPKHPDYDHLSMWGEGFDPQVFDLDAINELFSKWVRK